MDSNSDHAVGLSFPVLFSTLLRSFFIQGSFSIKYRQNTGFAFCMEPSGKRLWTTPDDHRAFIKRHMDYYNGNPFMITLVLGAVVRLEEMLKRGESTEQDILGFKKAVGAATGSIGDRLFWARLRPLCILLGLLASFYIGLWGVAVALAAFNIPNILLRWYWLKRGYQLGTGVVKEIQNRNILKAMDVMEYAVAAILGFVAVTLLTAAEQGPGWSFAGGTALFFMSIALYKRGRGVTAVLTVSLALVAAAGCILSIVF